MKLIQANPKSDNEQKIIVALRVKERELRHGNTSFTKAGRDKWKHKKFQGSVVVSTAPENIVFAKVSARNEVEEGKLFEAFVGYLTRHCGQLIDILTVYYR
jgi:hypothetical protein